MFHLANIFVFLFYCISSILIADAGLPLPPAATIRERPLTRRAGGYYETPKSAYENLKVELQNSNVASALSTRDSCVRVVKILSAYQQVVAGMNYKIKATIKINNRLKVCCFKVFRGLSRDAQFNVNCADCGDTCERLNECKINDGDE